MAKYSKAIAALVGLVTVLVAHFAGVDSDEAFVVSAVTAALVTLGVFAVPNKSTY
jgi:hypothetical protein